jgi:hypothetical protein
VKTALGRHLIAPLAIALLLGLFAVPASASPGAYKVLLAETYAEQPLKLKAQVASFPDVATVDTVNTGKETPSAATLGNYDVVVSIGDSNYFDHVAWGNALADYVDSGGVVVQAGYDSWENEEAQPTGRFASGGYAPFIPGPNPNSPTSLGAFDASSPLMQGVTNLTTEDNTNPALAPGASLVARWVNGNPAVAQKGRVVSITAFIGDDNGEVWSGNYGRLIVNAARTFRPVVPPIVRPTLIVANGNLAGGTVTSSAGGISCGAVCSASFANQTPVALTASPNKGFVFGGFGGACTGITCSLTMDTAKAVSASFYSFGLAKKSKLNKKKGTALLTVEVGGPGTVTLAGPKVKKQTKSKSSAGKVAIPILAKGKARKALKSKGRAKVRFNVTFAATGGSAAAISTVAHLRLLDGG